MRSWTSCLYGWADTVITDLPTAMNMTTCQALSLASDSTRCSQALGVGSWGGRVSLDVDQNGSGPIDRPWTSREGPLGPKDLIAGVFKPAARSYEPGGGDVIRVPVPARAHTAPRRGLSDLAGRWSFDGVFVLSEYAPARTSAEGVGMT